MLFFYVQCSHNFVKRWITDIITSYYWWNCNCMLWYCKRRHIFFENYVRWMLAVLLQFRHSIIQTAVKFLFYWFLIFSQYAPKDRKTRIFLFKPFPSLLINFIFSWGRTRIQKLIEYISRTFIINNLRSSFF